jgi:thiol-disulfide isomerase/thioredoxin
LRQAIVLAALFLAGRAAAAGQTRMPAYRLPLGTKLFYTTLSGVQPLRTAQRWQVWVVGLNPDSSFRVLVKRTQIRSETDSMGKTTEEEWRSDWARCALYPNGRIPASVSLDQADLRSLFPPLPVDSLAAVSGWQRLDSAMNETELYHLDNKSTVDSIWLIEFTHKTPLDDVYLLSTTGRYYFDTRHGLVQSKETEEQRGWGSSQGTTKRVTSLDSVTRLDTGTARKFESELAVFLEADSAYAALLDRASENPARKQALLDSAQAVMDSGRARVTDSTVQTMFDDEVGTLEETALQLDQDAAWRDSLVGHPAPAWSLPDLDGRKHSLKDYRGKVVILDFWYRGCPWCIRAMPQLNELAQKYQGKPVAVIGMNTDKDTADARFVVSKLRLGYTNVLARGEDKQYRVQGFPTLYVIDAKGVVRDIHVGYSPDLGVKLAATVERLLAGK